MTLHCERIGAGAPWVLLHGWGFHSGIWNGFAESLAKDCRVHLLDLPGHGHSRDIAAQSFDELVDLVAACVPDHSVVLGWSLGGLAALQLALRNPRKARALALVSSTPRFVAGDGWNEAVDASTLAQFVHGLQRDPAAALESFVHLNAVGARGARASVRSLSARLADRPWPAASALASGLDMLRTTDLRREIAAVDVPTVVIHGARDRIVPVGAGRWLANTIRGARFKELPASAHLPFVTQPEAVLEALRDLDD